MSDDWPPTGDAAGVPAAWRDPDDGDDCDRCGASIERGGLCEDCYATVTRRGGVR